MTFARALFLIACASTPAFSQTAASAPQDPKARAQYEFMMARHLESTGDMAGALAALERARKLDPTAGEIPAEIAGYYYRQNRAAEAVAAAEQAIKLDKDNVEAHHILGTIYSAWADGVSPPPAGQTPASVRASAIEHLGAIQNTPLASPHSVLPAAWLACSHSSTWGWR